MVIKKTRDRLNQKRSELKQETQVKLTKTINTEKVKELESEVKFLEQVLEILLS